MVWRPTRCLDEMNEYYTCHFELFEMFQEGVFLCGLLLMKTCVPAYWQNTTQKEIWIQPYVQLYQECLCGGKNSLQQLCVRSSFRTNFRDSPYWTKIQEQWNALQSECSPPCFQSFWEGMFHWVTHHPMTLALLALHWIMHSVLLPKCWGEKMRMFRI